MLFGKLIAAKAQHPADGRADQPPEHEINRVAQHRAGSRRGEICGTAKLGCEGAVVGVECAGWSRGGGAAVDPMSSGILDQWLTDFFLPLSDLFLDRWNVDLVLGEFLVDLLKLGAVAFVPRPPERQGNLPAFVNQGLHLRSARGNGVRALTRRWTNFVPGNWRAACVHDYKYSRLTVLCPPAPSQDLRARSERFAGPISNNDPRLTRQCHEQRCDPAR